MAQSLELRGEGQAQAREQIFRSPIAEQMARKYDDPLHKRRIRDLKWFRYSSQFQRRRWLIAALAAVVGPVFHDRSQDVVSLLGYALVGPALLALLCLRFSFALSFWVALICVLSPPMYKWAYSPTDMWGLALELVALAAAVLTAERGHRWLLAWVFCLAVLSITRDNGVAVLVSAMWLFVRLRSNRAFWLVVSGVTVSLPALLAFPVPLRDNFAYVIDGYAVPTDSSWHFIFLHYFGQLQNTVATDLAYPSELPVSFLFYGGLVAVAACMAFLLLFPPRRDSFFEMQRGCAIGGVIYLLLANNPQGFRLELVLLPVAAAAVAYAISRFRPRIRPLSLRLGNRASDRAFHELY
jgi:hypothetical protein